jgi:heme a synthase
LSQSQLVAAGPVRYSPIVHRIALVLTLSVFPLIWVGGLVTTYGAGMAVPDWPGTYGWNMFLYPPSTWLYGGFDLMVEHGHRLLGSLVGLLSIALLAAAFKYEARRWFRWWCGMVLVAVVIQGVLGGIRVLLDERMVAMIHGCLAQLFLAIATGTAVMSSRWWLEFSTGKETQRSDQDSRSAKDQEKRSRLAASKRLAISSTVVLAAAYGQVVAGAQLRHFSAATTPEHFFGLVHLHLLLAATVLLASLWTAWNAAVCRDLWGGVKRTSFLILLVVCGQILLGLGTWLVNYALPWQELSRTLAQNTITAKGYWESIVVTGHVAGGAIIVCLSTVVCLASWRSRVVFLKESVD